MTQELTQNEKRIAIAEALGWKMNQTPCWHEDLNACHEAENALDDDQHSEFRDHLWELCDAPVQPSMKSLRAYASAAASLRAEALYQTLCKPQTP